MTSAPWVLFERGGARYALPVAEVDRIEPVRARHCLPRPTPGIEGALLIGGVLIPVMSTALPPCLLGAYPHRLIVLRHEQPFAFQVDSVEGVVHLAEAPTIPGDADPPLPMPARTALRSGHEVWGVLSALSLLDAEGAP